MNVIRRYISDNKTVFRTYQAQVALAASLVHDVGHGMFSHSFEEIGKQLNLSLARHEILTEQLIRDSEIARIFEEEFSSGFATDVAEVIKAGKPGNLYNSVVSSQFDADRLDYMQRDRLMTGVESSGIDATWLMANLEIASVPAGADADAAGNIETLVLGPKAFRTAESYVLALFQLYPNVYFHKATRAAEKVFTSLVLRVIELVQEGHGDKSGLPLRHPIRRFAEQSDQITNALELDDSVFWGALPLMIDADDSIILQRSKCLWLRSLPKCLDIRQWFEEQIAPIPGGDQKQRDARNARIRLCCPEVLSSFGEWASSRTSDCPPTFVDQARRDPYKKFQDSQSLLNQILIRSGDRCVDMTELSPVVASAERFEVCRVYISAGDTEARSVLENEMATRLQTGGGL